MQIVIFILFAFLFIQLYRRYIPAFGIPCKEKINPNTYIIDIRDYNLAWKDQTGNHNIPYGYLKRYHQEIPQKNLHVIAGSLAEKNLGIRYLKKMGFEVVGYSLADCDCKVGKWVKKNIKNEGLQ